MRVTRTTSPGSTLPRPHENRTRLIASVALRTNTVSAGRAPISRASFSRPPSYSSVASAASWWIERWMFALERR